MAHISELTSKPIKDPTEAAKIGDKLAWKSSRSNRNSTASAFLSKPWKPPMRAKKKKKYGMLMGVLRLGEAPLHYYEIKPMKSSPVKGILIFVAALVVLGIIFSAVNMNTANQPVDLGTLAHQVTNGEVKSMTVRNFRST